VVIGSRTLGHRIAKRVVGLPGDHVRLEDSWKLYINDQPLIYSDEDTDRNRMEATDHHIALHPDPASRIQTRFANDDLLLGSDEYFVLGDNRLSSDDSRQIGPVHRQEIQGKLCLIWYSFDQRASRFRFWRMMHLVQ
jgi:signal peptidase I